MAWGMSRISMGCGAAARDLCAAGCRRARAPVLAPRLASDSDTTSWWNVQGGEHANWSTPLTHNAPLFQAVPAEVREAAVSQLEKQHGGRDGRSDARPSPKAGRGVCVCVCVSARVCACVCVCVRACVQCLWHCVAWLTLLQLRILGKRKGKATDPNAPRRKIGRPRKDKSQGVVGGLRSKAKDKDKKAEKPKDEKCPFCLEDATTGQNLIPPSSLARPFLASWHLLGRVSRVSSTQSALLKRKPRVCTVYVSKARLCLTARVCSHSRPPLQRQGGQAADEEAGQVVEEARLPRQRVLSEVPRYVQQPHPEAAAEQGQV